MIDRKSVNKRRQKGLRIIREKNSQFGTSRLDVNDKKTIGRYGTTPKLCSCWMCGNPRRSRKGHARLSIKERVYNDRKFLREDC